MPTTVKTAGRAGAGRTPGPPTRRRGAQLETALLEAAWAELTAVGYSAFTMEGVATRAKTSRAVLYRRWSNRPDLAMAAIRHHAAHTVHDLPDTATLRDDVLALLRQLSASVSEMAGVLSFMFADYFDTAAAFALGSTGTAPRQHAQQNDRGHRACRRTRRDRPRPSQPRIASLPVDLVRHDLIMNRTPVADNTLVEIVDRIFLPLVLANQPKERGER